MSPQKYSYTTWSALWNAQQEDAALKSLPDAMLHTQECIITAHVLPGSIVVTDAWGGYNNVSTINNGVYNHQVVVHAQNFVNPVHNDIYIQTIEGLWMHTKRKLNTIVTQAGIYFPATLQSSNDGIHNNTHVFGQ